MDDLSNNNDTHFYLTLIKSLMIHKSIEYKAGNYFMTSIHLILYRLTLRESFPFLIKFLKL